MKQILRIFTIGLVLLMAVSVFAQEESQKEEDTDFDEVTDSIDDNPLCNSDGRCDDSGTYPEKDCDDCNSNWWIWLLLILILIIYFL